MMSESVTVTVQNGNEAGRTGAGPGRATGALALNVPYFHSVPGMIKIAQLVIGIFCIIFGSSGYGGWYLTVAVTGFILTLLWTFIYLFSIREAIAFPINWPLTEMLNLGIWAILYLTVSIVELGRIDAGASHAFAAIFGICNTLAYAAASYYAYLEHVNSQ